MKRLYRETASLYLYVALLLLAVTPSGCIHASTAPPPAPRPGTGSPTAEAPPAVPQVDREPFLVRLRYKETKGAQEIRASETLVVTTPDQGLKRLPSGTWHVSHRATGKATLAYPVYVKAFAHNETGQLAAERQRWRDRGYSTFATTLGRAVSAADGTVYDGRTYWLGIKRCASEGEAEALKKKLRGQKVWAWSRSEIRKATPGILSFQDAQGDTILTSPVPVRIRSAGLVAVSGARQGKAPLAVPAPLELALNRSGELAVDGYLPLEVYLQGILPAEMYPDWPLEALKAQAVAARSEVIAHAAGKHHFDGFDFCIEQHCRAYAGEEGRKERTDRAVRETADQVLVDGDNAIVPTVFSANCGGWTENNENVWDGAPAASLRGRSDQSGTGAGPGNGAVSRWITKPPPSYCAHDAQYHRWTRSLPLGRLSKKFDGQYGIGALKGVEALERGVSGRLKAVRLVGTRKSVVVRKELNIRRAFEGLPSALCLFEVDRGSGVVRVRGAGRGHGVGLCQQGARGMAETSHDYDAILHHYFTGVRISEI